MTADTRRTCVIWNPAGGRGRVRREMPKLMRRWSDADFRATEGPGHAAELAGRAAAQGMSPVVAAGGDGTVHEVANGLLRGGHADTVFSVLPFGSANDYAYTLGMIDWWKQGGGGPRETVAVDVGRVRATDTGKEEYFVNCLGMGFNGAVTVEARKVRWLWGMPLYAWALVRAAALHFRTPAMTVSFDGVTRTVPTLSLSVLLAQREGGFPLMPSASLTDGLFDCLQAGGALTRLGLLRLLPAMATGRFPPGHPHLWQGRAARVEVDSSEPLRIHLDGEFFCHPEDGLKRFTFDVLPAKLLVETYPAGRVRAPLPRPAAGNAATAP